VSAVIENQTMRVVYLSALPKCAPDAGQVDEKTI
jgi:hypothetical protein